MQRPEPSAAAEPDAKARLAELEAVFAALAHAARRQVLLVVWFRGGTMSAGDIAGRFSHTWPTTSRHLRVLEDAGLLAHERQGRTRIYRVDQRKLDVVRAWLRWFDAPTTPRTEEETTMPTISNIQRHGAALRDIAMSYPGAHEDFPWGETAVKVKGKAFLFMHMGEELSLSCKLPASHEMALMLPFAKPTGYGLGKSGWVSASFGPDQDPPLDLLRDWIDESYRAIAPKKLAAALAGERTANDAGSGKAATTAGGAGGQEAATRGGGKASTKTTASKTGSVSKASAKEAATRGAGKASAKKTASKTGTVSKASTKEAATRGGGKASAKKTASKTGTVSKASAKEAATRGGGKANAKKTASKTGSANKASAKTAAPRTAAGGASKANATESASKATTRSASKASGNQSASKTAAKTSPAARRK